MAQPNSLSRECCYHFWRACKRYSLPLWNERNDIALALTSRAWMFGIETEMEFLSEEQIYGT